MEFFALFLSTLCTMLLLPYMVALCEHTKNLLVECVSTHLKHKRFAAAYDAHLTSSSGRILLQSAPENPQPALVARPPAFNSRGSIVGNARRPDLMEVTTLRRRRIIVGFEIYF